VRKFTGLRPQTCRPQLRARAKLDPVIKVRSNGPQEPAHPATVASSRVPTITHGGEMANGPECQSRSKDVAAMFEHFVHFRRR
jgi:hypothetical protein